MRKDRNVEGKTSKTRKTKGYATGRAKGAACALLAASAVALASARPAYAVTVNGPSFNFMISNYVSPGMALVGLATLAISGYNYINYKDEEGPKAKIALGGMVGGGIMAAIGGGAVIMLQMS